MKEMYIGSPNYEHLSTILILGVCRAEKHGMIESSAMSADRYEVDRG